MRHFEYASQFAGQIRGIIDMKRSDGYKYEVDAWHLKKFDDFCLERFPDSKSITKELSDSWCTRRDTEGSSFFSRRINALRQLALYMVAIGMDAYVPRDIASHDKPILTIPSASEIQEFFYVLDNRKTNARTYRSICAYRIMFRLYYCCGLRLSEARKLKKSDVDVKGLSIRVTESKGHKDRLVYLPEDAKNTVAGYLRYICDLYPDTEYIFPGGNTNAPVTGCAVERIFRLCWAQTSGFKNHPKPPTVHCLRHAFVVERINQWAKDGTELNVMLPYLSKYLGHSSPSETHYYYHLVESAFAVIRDKGIPTTSMIPEVKSNEE